MEATSTQREQVLALRRAGLGYKRIASVTGVAPTTIRRWVDPSFAERDRGRVSLAKHTTYRGTCERCGGPTTGCNGPGKAPKLCAVCFTEKRVPEHGTNSRYTSAKHKCRCDECRAAHAAYMLAYYRRKRAAA